MNKRKRKTDKLMSFTWATVDRDFSDRPHYLHKSLSHLWGRKIYYDFTKTDNEHTLEVLVALQSHFIFMYLGDCQWSDFTNGGKRLMKLQTIQNGIILMKSFMVLMVSVQLPTKLSTENHQQRLWSRNLQLWCIVWASKNPFKIFFHK